MTLKVLLQKTIEQAPTKILKQRGGKSYASGGECWKTTLKHVAQPTIAIEQNIWRQDISLLVAILNNN